MRGTPTPAERKEVISTPTMIFVTKLCEFLSRFLLILPHVTCYFKYLKILSIYNQYSNCTLGGARPKDYTEFLKHNIR